ncbi:hypothetical protein [Bradyrhizobium symbiodeficiens]|uniref:hypothetical protein n=1 Tax=Bradyrhizobium symbiodeficiens TaxID=1404367 RepID=UPI00140FE0CD|nr:hypothetical protein [Bradyrhizobium symbiodeficiens]QIP03371.1 hypothetical protein HAU86_27870 [Bradyrhizobium symbiodeficiens]
MTSSSQHGSPVFYKAGQPIVSLRNVRLGQAGREDDYREEFLQTLVYEQPDVIPMEEIEPAFRPLISVCTELPTSSGSVDNVWLTPEGGLILGECKLVRNPQSRREVIAQALDYARAVTGWHFEDLQAAARKARKEPSFLLWDLVKKHSNLHEHQFVDAIERRLKYGRLMLLVISDGIHEGVEALADFLQLHAGVHAGLALLDLSIWEGHGDGLLIVPRIPLKTVLVERGIVIFDGVSGRIDPPSPGSGGSKIITASEPEFYAQLEQRLPGMSEKLKTFVSSLKPLGVEPEYGKSLFLRFQNPHGIQLSAATIEPTGSIWLLKTITDSRLAGNQAAGEEYLAAIAQISSGSIKRYDNGTIDVRGSDDKSLRLPALIQHAQGWKAAIERLINATSQSKADQ